MVIRSEIPETGGRKLQEHLLDPEYGVPITVGRDKLFDTLRAQGLLFKHKPRKVYTSVSDPDHQVYPNLLENLTVTRPNQVWVTDITYLQLVNGKHCYLSIMTDYYSRKIVGFTVQKDMTAESTLATFNKAYKSIKPAPGLIHHSDKGSQYTSGIYTNRLQECGVDISMTGPNKCYDNAIAERINRTIKYEFYLRDKFRDIEQARKVVADAVYLYNNKRLHCALKLKTPNEFYNNALAS